MMNLVHFFCLTEIAMVASTLFIKDLKLQADFSEAALWRSEFN